MQVTDEMVTSFCRANPSHHDLSVNEIRDGIAAALNAMWRPISEAPKDGTKILWSCGDGNMSVIHWPEYDLCFEGGYFVPLPSPPAGEKTEPAE